MQIQSQAPIAPVQPVSEGRLRFPHNSQSPVPGLDSDTWQPSSAGVPIVDYNTGCHDEQKLSQPEVTQLPFFQRVIKGDANAPIITCQESGPSLATTLQKLAKQTGNFSVYVEKTSHTQCNIVVVPKRYTVLKEQNHYFGGRLAQLFSSLKDWIFHGVKPNFGQIPEHRGYMQLQIKDPKTGKTFNLVNTHISGWAPMRQRQVDVLVKGLAQIKAEGLPLVVDGDFNTNSEVTNTAKNSDVTKVWQTMGSIGMQDLIPVPKPGGDQMLGLGVKENNVHMYQGREISLPGHPDAESMSEHDPIEMNLTFNQ